MDIINKILWAIAISLILVNSIYFSVKLSFPQLKIFKAINNLKKGNNSEEISPMDTLIMALSSKIGVGSLAGTALSIYYGGIGTIFWMYISTFFLSIINYIENALAIIYKKNNRSGPHYYIKDGLNNSVLSKTYAVIVIILYTGLFTTIQNNTITTLTTNVINVNKVTISLLITITSGFIITKGIKTISRACNKIFPAMMLLFIIIGFFILIKNIHLVPSIITLIIKSAFNNKSIKGGLIYSIIISIQKTVFANEAGVGTSAIIAGSTNNNNYNLQANIGLIQTYFINFIVLGLTSLIIITAQKSNFIITNGIEMTEEAFSYHLGNTGEYLLLIVLCLFSFSTIITIYYYGECSLYFLTKKKYTNQILKILTIVLIFFGGIINAKTIWTSIDILLAILTIINMYAIYKLRLILISKLSKK